MDLLNKVPILRIPLFADREVSRIRSLFTLLVFTGIILCFGGLTAWKWENRSLIQVTSYNPSYQTFLALNASHPLSCGVSNTVIYYEHLNATDPLQGIIYGPGSNWDFDSSFLDNPCWSNYSASDSNEGTGFYYISCFYSYLTCGNIWMGGNFLQSNLMTPIAIEYTFSSSAQDTLAVFGNLLAEMMYNAVDFERFTLEYNVAEGNANNLNNFMSAFYGQKNSPGLPSTVNNQFSLTLDMLVQSRDDCADSLTVDYGKYYEKSQVNQCTYIDQQSVIEVLSFALTTTASLVALVIFIFKMLYLIVLSKEAKVVGHKVGAVNQV